MTFVTDILARQAIEQTRRIEQLEASVRQLERSNMAHQMSPSEWLERFDPCICESPTCSAPLHVMSEDTIRARLGFD